MKNNLVFTGDGLRLPITNMFDIDGDPTDDPWCATTLVAALPDGRWLACTCAPHEIDRARFYLH